MAHPDSGKPGFTLRAVFIAIGLSLFLLASSTYIAIKLGALPWPIVFSVIVSGGALKILSGSRKLNLHEVNVAQAGGSVGGLVAAGIAFTVPGIIFLNQTRGLEIAWPNPWTLGILTALAGLLGVLLSMPLKYTFIDREQLPYPAGTAGAELLKLGDTGGRRLWLIVMVGAAAGVFALLRDVFFPAGFTFAALTAAGIYLTLNPMPLALAGGYILGPRASLSWLGGAAIGWLALIPLLVQDGLEFASAKSLAQNLGMGMVLGAGIGFLAGYVLPRAGTIFAPVFKSRKGFGRLFPLLSALGAGGLLLSGVPLGAAVLAVLGVWMMVAVAARMTGETNIDPLEQFGIFVGLVIAFIYNIASLELSMYASFMIVTFVSVACAIAGDAGHDYKSADIVGTRFFDVVKVDLIAVIFAGLAAPFVMETIRSGLGNELFTPAMPAPQAQLVAGSIFGFEYPRVFLAGFGIAFVLEILNTLLPQRARNRVLIMPLGIGLFLGMGLAIPIALGSLVRAYIDKKRTHLYHAVLLIAAGVMGGEGIAGFSAGALTTAGLSFRSGALALAALFAVILSTALFFYARKPGPGEGKDRGVH
ncbi:MAG: OPT/YSL family transporter [Calditrichaceae bacterium]|nr:OPT/YSL family transporter [Calditrichia bacterium]NUQ43662.1 OPT/YSL family transporter [Calditrichaceae bacterium]